MTLRSGMIVRAQCPCGCGIVCGPMEIDDQTVDCTPEQNERCVQDQMYAAFYEKCIMARKFSAADVKLERCMLQEIQLRRAREARRGYSKV